MAHHRSSLLILASLIYCCAAQLDRQQLKTPQGCIAYSPDSNCRECAAPAYRLSAGTCLCSAGYRQADDGTCSPGPCYQRCGQTYLKQSSGYCHCDYFCDQSGDCCGGTASKNALCPTMEPSKNKTYITNCDGPVNRHTGEPSARRTVTSSRYLPGMCWCDEYCEAAGDCCPRCSTCKAARASGNPAKNRPSRGSGAHRPAVGAGGARAGTRAGARTKSGGNVAVAAANKNAGSGGGAGGSVARRQNASGRSSSSSSSVSVASIGDASWDDNSQITQQEQQQQRDKGRSKVAVAADSSSPLGVAVAAVAAASANARQAQPDDCGAHEPYPLQLLATAPGSVGIAAIPETQLEAESQMQACQAADTGPPANPIVLPLYWTAGRVCRSGSCTGGRYTAELIQEQIDYVNRLYAHIGIQFKWDEEIHTADASTPDDIDVCLDPSGRCWVCRQQRFGDQVAINVVTSPTHVGGTSLGVTLYPSYMATGAMPGCANWVFLYEKTLPGLGGRSLIDGGLADSGATLAHEIGHQLMLHHTWYEERGYGSKPSIRDQCEMSASTHPADVISGRSDGVRDTPAQSLNGTINSVTDILRFVDCNPQTGAYSNTTAYAQQSCNAAVGFPQGDQYFNNFNNLMSYGDKTCLRTLTAGQGARARCAIKCMRRMQC